MKQSVDAFTLGDWRIKAILIEISAWYLGESLRYLASFVLEAAVDVAGHSVEAGAS